MGDTLQIGILGAGLQGVCTALELARRGFDVDLIDRHARPLTGAGGVSEGKVHLGFVYGNDPSLRTAATMVEAALSFEPLLRRWLGADWPGFSISSPIHYCVHRDSQLGGDAVRAHFEEVRGLLIEACARGACSYLGRPVDPDAVYRSLEESETAEFGPAVEEAFVTMERAVDVVAIAEQLRRQVARCPAIRFEPGVTVTSAVIAGNRTQVELAHNGEIERREYGQVVNSLWDGRLAIDHTAGIAPRRRWIHRFKYGIEIERAAVARRLPSSTVVQGPFGDIVRFAGGKLYLSWYPACLAMTSTSLAPPAVPREPAPERAREIADQTLEHLAQVCPAVAGIDLDDEGSWAVRGGPIFAWGATDIDDPGSELHSRADRWIDSEGGYHSVNTAKYTLAPRLAVELADRVEAARHAAASRRVVR